MCACRSVPCGHWGCPHCIAFGLVRHGTSPVTHQPHPGSVWKGKALFKKFIFTITLAIVHFFCVFLQIDVLVNNAGRSQRAVASDTALEVDRAIIELNTVGTLSLTKAVLPHMVKQRDGQIVVISSVAGVIGRAHSCCFLSNC